MTIRFLFGPLLVLVFVLTAAALSPSRPAAGNNILNLPATPYRYANVELPAHFTQPGRNHDNTPPDNPLSDHGATLGRVLFYDRRLSANNTTSCASCHVQAHAFADPKPFSRGFHGARTDRRAMPLVNVRYYERARFFWDERAGNLEEMVAGWFPVRLRVMPRVLARRLQAGPQLRIVMIVERNRPLPGRRRFPVAFESIKRARLVGERVALVGPPGCMLRSTLEHPLERVDAAREPG
jgi:di-heme cytochrome c peroxidase